MKLVRTIKKGKLLASDWGIYELSEEQQKKFNGKFALSQGIFSDFILTKKTEDELLSELKDYNYEGIFQTELEAFYQVKLLEMQKKIDMLQDVTDKFIEVYNIDNPEWYQSTR